MEHDKESIQRVMVTIGVFERQANKILDEVERQKDIAKSEVFNDIRCSRVDNHGECGCYEKIKELRKKHLGE
jgi:hypothetical protein